MRAIGGNFAQNTLSGLGAPLIWQKTEIRKNISFALETQRFAPIRW
jgi:hypothetical protein